MSARNYALISIHPNGRVEMQVQRRQIRLEQIQKVCGGSIQEVPYMRRFLSFSRGTAYCNEEGKLHDLPYNEAATEAWRACLGDGLDDVLCGTVAFCCRTDEEVTDGQED